MSFTYNTLDTFKGSEKDWAANLGMMDWDSTKIVFTKRQFMEFLKYIGTSVDPNYANIQKLPRYCEFAKVTAGASAQSEQPSAGSDAHPAATTNTPSAPADDFRPTRRVRDAPGGAQSLRIFGGDEYDALSKAPPKPKDTDVTEVKEVPPAPAEAAAAPTPAPAVQASVNDDEPRTSPSDIKPSRRVRTGPGGDSSLSNLWGGDDEQEAFKPTRRVRTGPGGEDHLGFTGH